MNMGKRKIQAALLLFGIAALVLFSNKIPFWIYEDRELFTSVQQFFSLEHLRRLLPLVVIVLLSALIIGLCIIVRKRIYLADPEKERYAKKRFSPVRKTASRQKPSRFTVIRWLCMITFSFFMIFGGILFGFQLQGIELPVLSCPTNRQQLMESSCYFLAHIPELLETHTIQGLFVFALSTIGFAILLGRMICGFLCPMGLIQDIMHLIRQKTKTEGITLTEQTYKKLTLIKWLMILLMLGVVFAGGNFCDFCPALAVSPVLAGLKTSLYFSGYMMIFVLVGSFFKRRMWCNICPLGYMIGLFHRVSPFRVKKDIDACTECGACYEACPMGIKMIYTEREKTDVTDINCIMCGECVRRCPEDHALSLSFAGKDYYTASRRQVLSGYRKDTKDGRNDH